MMSPENRKERQNQMSANANLKYHHIGGRFAPWITWSIFILRIFFILALLLQVCSLLLFFFSYSDYYYQILTPTILDALVYTVIYASYCFVIFGGMPLAALTIAARFRIKNKVLNHKLQKLIVLIIANAFLGLLFFSLLVYARH